MDEDEPTTASALLRIASALRSLGTADAATHLGAIEFLGMAIEEAGKSISASIDGLADAIREAKE